ncbi:MAG: hypothetical protein EHM55_15555 [Acidobacteria bacterium]|nr:MAG: hypothetical protein EHM55_15555 [Acidobacteriota bacterium]
MSVEALVLLALFIVLSLIQQLTQVTRQRNQHPPEPAERQSPGAPQPLARTPPLPGLAGPPLPDTTPHAASDEMAAPGRMRSRDTGGPATLVLTPHRTRGRRAAEGLRTGRDLRRAIVLMAMLGPCRASSPYEWPERAGRQ